LADSLYALVKNGKLEALRRAAPPTFDWKALDRNGIPPLHHVVAGLVQSSIEGDDAVSLASWLIAQGADPSIAASEDCEESEVCVFWEEGKEVESSKIEIYNFKETAITYVLRWKETIKVKAAEPDSRWGDVAADVQDELDRLLDAFTAEPLAEAKREVHAIDSTVVQLWEDVLSDDASHDLVFECEHGKRVGAHALVVASACRYVWSLEGFGSTGSLARRRRPCLVPQQQLRRPLC